MTAVCRLGTRRSCRAGQQWTEPEDARMGSHRGVDRLARAGRLVPPVWMTHGVAGPGGPARARAPAVERIPTPSFPPRQGEQFQQARRQFRRRSRDVEGVPSRGASRARLSFSQCAMLDPAPVDREGGLPALEASQILFNGQRRQKAVERRRLADRSLKSYGPERARTRLRPAFPGRAWCRTRTVQIRASGRHRHRGN